MQIRIYMKFYRFQAYVHQTRSYPQNSENETPISSLPFLFLKQMKKESKKEKLGQTLEEEWIPPQYTFDIICYSLVIVIHGTQT